MVVDEGGSLRSRRASRKKLLELKAHCRDLGKARSWAKTNATSVGKFRQADTYVRVQEGRLKIREIEGKEAGSLILYSREDVPTVKRSQVLLLEVDKAEELREFLETALGVLVTVEKRREIYRWKAVQIHLDEVAGLGSFLEFERPIGSPGDERDAQAEFEHLRSALGVEGPDIVAGSYSDLILAKGTQGD